MGAQVGSDEQGAVNYEPAGLRQVGGRLVDAFVARSEHAQVEVLRRHSTGRISWRFKQSSPTVFWFRSGVRSMRLNIDGTGYDTFVTATGRLCYFPPSVSIEGDFVVDPTVDYFAVFLDPRLVERHGLRLPDQPLTGMTHGPLEHGLHDLARDTRRGDRAAGLLVEGWALQSLAHLTRIQTDLRHPRAPFDPGLPAASLARVERYVRERLADPLGVDELAEVAGFSRRHFLRAFKQRTGQTPMRYVHALRIDQAKLLLAESDEPVTAIAAACGFSHAQHLSSAFRHATAMTPTEYRRQR
jgi:AraC family transcriptional regulator